MFTASLINDYSQNPINNFIMENPTISHSEWNSICDDSIEIFLKIENNNIINNFSYIWELSIVWLASASIIAEQIIWKNIDEILNRDFNFMRLIWFEVSPKRKYATVLPILAIRNAIHLYKKDWIIDELEDLI